MTAEAGNTHLLGQLERAIKTARRRQFGLTAHVGRALFFSNPWNEKLLWTGLTQAEREEYCRLASAAISAVRAWDRKHPGKPETE